MATLAGLGDIASNFIIPLEHYGVIALKGDDKETYLQGQVTVDVPGITNTQARRSAHCDFKGKAWSLQTIVRHDQQFLLSLPSDVLDISLAQLNKYGVFSKVDIVDASENYHQFAVSGEQAQKWISDVFGALPDGDLAAVSNEAGVAIRLDAPVGVYLIIASNTLIGDIQQFANSDGVEQYDARVFEALSVAAGIPHITAAHSNEYVPQMVNWQALGGIDFRKGCYMGQEVVARTKYLGKNKRAAFIFRVDAGVPLPADAMVEKKIGENWRRGGAVIRSAILGEETWLLAVLNNDTENEDIFRLASAHEYEFSIQALPYVIEQEKSNVRK